jgi:hypothetical protein
VRDWIAAGIRGARHHAAQRVDLLDEMSLADATDGGLQLIWPSVSMDWVSSSVRAPMRAAASAASVPACPPADHDYVKCRCHGQGNSIGSIS